MPAAPRNHPKFAGFDPLPLPAAKDANVLEVEAHTHFPTTDDGNLGDWPLFECSHSTGWV